MSLDVYLYQSKTLTCDCGKVHEIETGEELYQANITHNLNSMAQFLGIYHHVWRPEEIEIEKASQLIEPLKKAIEYMRENPAKCMEYDASNGWGTYDNFLPWLNRYLQACIDYPDARVVVSR